MVSPYKSFKELARQEVEDRVYGIRIDLKESQVLVMAPHGGKIEPGTTEIAEAIAGEDYSFYSFEGLKQEGDNNLHIESHLFDEPQALQAVERAGIVVTVHGQLDRKEAFVMVGGLHACLGGEIKRQLESAGFKTRPPTKGLEGTDPGNICNRGRLKGGVQLEISRKIHDALRTNGKQLQAFANAVRKAIQMYLERRGLGMMVERVTVSDAEEILLPR